MLKVIARLGFSFSKQILIRSFKWGTVCPCRSRGCRNIRGESWRSNKICQISRARAHQSRIYLTEFRAYEYSNNRQNSMKRTKVQHNFRIEATSLICEVPLRIYLHAVQKIFEKIFTFLFFLKTSLTGDLQRC